VVEIALNVIGQTIYYTVPQGTDIGAITYDRASNNTSFITNASSDTITGLAVLQPGLVGAMEEGRLYWTHPTGIGVGDLAGTTLTAPSISLGNVAIAPKDVCVYAFELVNSSAKETDFRVFWTAGDVIGSATLDGLAPNAAFVKGLGSTSGLDFSTLPTANSLLTFEEANVTEGNPRPNAEVRLRAPGLASVTSANAAKLSIKVNPVTGQFSGLFNLTNTNFTPVAKRQAKYAGLIIPTPATHTTVADKLDGIGVGYFLLNQLPNSTVLPPTTLKTSPILSGLVTLEKSN
jgi:hypothetical protein